VADRNDKRARKKTHRDQVLAQQWAAYRRRRMVRWVAGGLIVLLLVGALAFASGGGGNDGGNDRPQARATETPVPPSEETPEPLPTAVACDAEAPAPADPRQYDAPPETVIEEGVDYGAVIETSCGDITVDLLEEQAPQTVNNFVFLAREGYFNGLIFHRIAQDFVVQAGDPNGLNGTEPDGPGYSIEDELPAGSNEYKFGALAMANAGPNTGGSQFFFVVSEQAAGLQPDYSIFGQASEDSATTLETIAEQKTFGGSNPARAEMPRKSVYIESIEITAN
jgi:cyclophilin family peptidyl-prolyl cis-trans isomerase